MFWMGREGAFSRALGPRWRGFWVPACAGMTVVAGMTAGWLIEGGDGVAFEPVGIEVEAEAGA